MIEKLSTRVERLEGPRFTIEQEIGRLINPQATRLSVFPAYTASLDAAMSLVPEGWECFDVDATAPELGVDWTLHRGKESVKATAADAAIALCAAALKARGL